MSKYRFRNKDIDTLSREELLEALTQALQHIERVSPPVRSLDFSDDRDIKLPLNILRRV